MKSQQDLKVIELLAEKRHRGDPLADQFVFDVLGDWNDQTVSMEERSKLAYELIRCIRSFRSNGEINNPEFQQQIDPRLAKHLATFFSQARPLPAWADLGKIKRSEEIFRENGVLACLLFFCASLPEVYLIPDISAVLNLTGQLENATEQRIRATATMILSVLLEGGQTSDDGVGVVLTLRARLIHAVIRYLLLRGNPAEVFEKLSTIGEHRIEPQALAGPPKGMFDALSTAGWDLKKHGIPCNQEEMAYTLLTFNYVFVRSLRRLGLKLSQADEVAYLHAWNVVGHYMGVDHDLLAFDFERADEIFRVIQHRAMSEAGSLDKGRRALGEALMSPIEKSIPIPRFVPLARLITEYLTSRTTVDGLGINLSVHSSHRKLFNFGIKSALRADSLAPKFKLDLSLVRFTVRVAGYQLMAKVLVDPEKPLDLPERQVQQVRKMLCDWSEDPKAPKWLNTLEDLVTTRGNWQIS